MPQESKSFIASRCVGNFPKAERSRLERAIEETDFPVYIKNVATDWHDREMPGFISVWIDGRNIRDLGPFWKVYRRLVAEESA